ncbi:hypothetical protein KDV41_15010 [Providencia stuartii]|nr:hypothetical protein [Providencia stuartii]AVL39253.1 hypothetical protein CEP70_04175 [Providencia stuartii]WBA58400.1 hypothetical protein O7C57_07480 [Providencia sp. 21OH12SH02B-Prov]GHB81744.1 hypothetical protein GCM10007290_01730 [Providencia thailandensis]HEM7515783.1 hypothetical protein [Providencia stuartii]
MEYKLLIGKRRMTYINCLLDYFKHEGKKPQFKAVVNNEEVIITLTNENLNNFFRDVYEELDCKQRCKYSDKDIYDTYALLYTKYGNITELGKLLINVITKYMPAYLNGEPYVYDEI